MSFVLQPWQLFFLILASWINRQQQEVIEYLRTENQVLKEKLGKKRIMLNDNQRRRLAVKGKILGRKKLIEIGTLFTPDTILRWHRELIAKKWDYSQNRKKKAGRPTVSSEIEALVLRMARENPSWGYPPQFSVSRPGNSSPGVLRLAFWSCGLLSVVAFVGVMAFHLQTAKLGFTNENSMGKTGRVFVVWGQLLLVGMVIVSLLGVWGLGGFNWLSFKLLAQALVVSVLFAYVRWSKRWQSERSQLRPGARSLIITFQISRPAISSRFPP